MTSFAISELGQVRVHSPGAMSWAKKAVIFKKLPYPPGAIPAHLKSYTERFKTAVATTCAGEMRAAKPGADRVNAMNACIAREMGGARKMKIHRK